MRAGSLTPAMARSSARTVPILAPPRHRQASWPSHVHIGHIDVTHVHGIHVHAAHVVAISAAHAFVAGWHVLPTMTGGVAAAGWHPHVHGAHVVSTAAAHGLVGIAAATEGGEAQRHS